MIPDRSPTATGADDFAAAAEGALGAGLAADGAAVEGVSPSRSTYAVASRAMSSGVGGTGWA